MRWWQTAAARLLARVVPASEPERQWFFVGSTDAGTYVDEESALRYAAVWRCVDVVAKAVAILPWSVYAKTGKGREELTDGNNVQWLLHTQPNTEMTPYSFKHVLMTHLLLYGNSYCEIERDLTGRPKWLWPIEPERVLVTRDDSGALVYRVRTTATQYVELPADDVLHTRGLGCDGIVGYSPIRMAAEQIGLGKAMDKFGARLFANGANMGGVLKHPGKLGDAAKKNIKDSLKEQTTGNNSLGWLVLEEGMTAERVAIPPEDAQFLDSRKFQTLEICRIFGVPPHKVMSLDRSTWNNIEHQELEFVTNAVQPWITQLEESANLKLFGRTNRGTVYTKFNMAALLRGDLKTRFEAYEIAHRNGWLNANEIRSLEEMNPIPNGDMYVMQGQMMTRQAIKKNGMQPPKPPGQQQQPDPGADPNADPNPPTLNGLVPGSRVINAARKRT